MMATVKTGMKTEYHPYCVKNSTTCLPDAKPPPKCVVNQTKATASEAGMTELFFNSEALQIADCEIFVLHIGTEPEPVYFENGLPVVLFIDQDHVNESVFVLLKIQLSCADVERNLAVALFYLRLILIRCLSYKECSSDILVQLKRFVLFFTRSSLDRLLPKHRDSQT